VAVAMMMMMMMLHYILGHADDDDNVQDYDNLCSVQMAVMDGMED
jgi:hypothetical protein